MGRIFLRWVTLGESVTVIASGCQWVPVGAWWAVVHCKPMVAGKWARLNFCLLVPAGACHSVDILAAGRRKLMAPTAAGQGGSRFMTTGSVNKY